MKLFIHACSIWVVLASIAIAQPKNISPDGKIGIDGSYGDLYLVDVASGRKLSPIFPPSQQDQISNVHLDVKWAPDGRTVAIKASYGTRLNEILLFTVSTPHILPLKIDSPDPAEVFKKQLMSDSDVEYDENIMGNWNDNSIKVLFGVGEEFKGRVRHFFVPTKLIISDGKLIVSKEAAKILDDGEYSAYLQKEQIQ